MTSGKKKFSKSNLNELVDDQVGIAEAQPQRDQMQPSWLAAGGRRGWARCRLWSQLPKAAHSDCKCSVGIVHYLCIKGNVYDPKASAELMYRWSCANSYHYVAYF